MSDDSGWARRVSVSFCISRVVWPEVEAANQSLVEQRFLKAIGLMRQLEKGQRLKKDKQ